MAAHFFLQHIYYPEASVPGRAYAAVFCFYLKLIPPHSIFYPQWGRIEKGVEMQVRTRFAPSPTGFLHIGGLRTALFAYLFARHNHGTFILRIEDTDRTRFVEGALEDIVGSLRWIGIEWEEGPDIGGPFGPYLQSERLSLYKTYAQKLLERDAAYKCYCTPERLGAVRKEREKQGLDTGYDRHCRNLPEKQKKRHEENGDRFVIRLKVPLEGETVFDDLIRGRITTKNDVLDDLVLLKSDGFPTYHLANVIDDHLMEITHVIRGDEWISSSPRHILLYRAFGWDFPVFAHVPVILAPGGGKLSKRHGATMVREFRERGYLSEAVLNYIALLGWSLDDKTELFTMEELIRDFNLTRVNKSSAVFSYDKLDWFNGVYIRSKTPEELYTLVLPYLEKEGIQIKDENDEAEEYLLAILPLVRERIKLLSEIFDHIWFFFDDRFEIKNPEELVPKKLSSGETVQLLKSAYAELEKVEPFDDEHIETALRKLVESSGLKVGQVFMTLRVATTGTKVSPGLFETMRVLGKTRVLSRIREAIETLQT